LLRRGKALIKPGKHLSELGVELVQRPGSLRRRLAGVHALARNVHGATGHVRRRMARRRLYDFKQDTPQAHTIRRSTHSVMLSF
jgi:hypothetical protein